MKTGMDMHRLMRSRQKVGCTLYQVLGRAGMPRKHAYKAPSQVSSHALQSCCQDQMLNLIIDGVYMRLPRCAIKPTGMPSLDLHFPGLHAKIGLL